MSNFDAMNEDQLRAHLRATAQKRGERFYVEEQGGEWVASLRFPSGLAGTVVPVDEGAAVLPGEGVSFSINAPDRWTAMRELAGLIAGEYG